MLDLRFGEQERYKNEPTRADINLAIAYYIMHGGKITKLKSGTCECPISPTPNMRDGMKLDGGYNDHISFKW